MSSLPGPRPLVPLSESPFSFGRRVGQRVARRENGGWAPSGPGNIHPGDYFAHRSSLKPVGFFSFLLVQSWCQTSPCRCDFQRRSWRSGPANGVGLFNALVTQTYKGGDRVERSVLFSVLRGCIYTV